MSPPALSEASSPHPQAAVRARKEHHVLESLSEACPTMRRTNSLNLGSLAGEPFLGSCGPAPSLPRPMQSAIPMVTAPGRR